MLNGTICGTSWPIKTEIQRIFPLTSSPSFVSVSVSVSPLPSLCLAVTNSKPAYEVDRASKPVGETRRTAAGRLAARWWDTAEENAGLGLGNFRRWQHDREILRPALSLRSRPVWNKRFFFRYFILNISYLFIW